MSDTLADEAPDVPGEQPVPETDLTVQPEEVEVETKLESAEEEAAPAEEPVAEPVEDANQAEPKPEEPGTKPEGEAKEEPEGEDQPGKRKLEEDDAEEPDTKKMNTGPVPMEMEVRLVLLFSVPSSALRCCTTPNPLHMFDLLFVSSVNAMFALCASRQERPQSSWHAQTPAFPPEVRLFTTFVYFFADAWCRSASGSSSGRHQLRRLAARRS